MARPTAAVYRRRRLTALGILAVLILLVVSVLRGGGGSFDLTQAQVRKLELEADPAHLTLSYSGDLLIHSPVWERAGALAGSSGGYDFAPLFKELKPYVAGVDIAYCHFETPMTPNPPATYPIFNTPPELAKGAEQAGWDVCDTASNHSLDQGEDGVDETIKAVGGARLGQTGSSAAADDLDAVATAEASGITVAYLACTTDTNGIPLPKPWSVNLCKPDQLLQAAASARKAGADAVIINVHWGGQIVPEYQTEPSSGQTALAKKLLASKDVTALVGQGPHVIQPIETIGDKYVVYSEGNLLSNQGAEAGLPENTQDGYVALLKLVVDGHGEKVTGVGYVPTWVNHPDYTVLPVGLALEKGEGDAATLRASYERTVDVVGSGDGVKPVPAKLP
jgi:poly-gamma-glutamate synthesis protein (capsule biosynthesis protein)